MVSEVEKLGEREAEMKITLENFIDGQFAGTAKHFDSVDPSTGTPALLIPDSGAEEVGSVACAPANTGCR